MPVSGKVTEIRQPFAVKYTDILMVHVSVIGYMYCQNVTKKRLSYLLWNNKEGLSDVQFILQKESYRAQQSSAR